MSTERSPLVVEAADLIAWAGRLDSRGRLPQLVRRLVLASIDDAILDFPANEGVQLGGWDGRLHSESGNSFVPLGTSAWELGTDSRTKAKADKDYKKRSEAPLGQLPAETTYVAVTLRRWKHKTRWADVKRREGLWRDVLAFDADDLATWLEQSPSVHLWLSAHLGRNPGTAEDLATFWETWSHVTRPPLSAAVMCAGRRENVDELWKTLEKGPCAIAVRSATSDEAIAFVASAFTTLASTAGERAMSRAVVVRDDSAWQALATHPQPLILIPLFRDRTRTPAAVGRGHQVILSLGADEAPIGATIDLPRVDRDQVREALLASGLLESRVEELASLGRSSIGALRRRLAIHPAALAPRWARADSGRRFVPALLAGQWDDTLPDDQAAVERLAGVSYNHYRGTLGGMARAADPPIRKVDRLWLVPAKDDAWSLLSHFIQDDDLANLEALVLEVLGEIDPQYELPLEERPFAAMKGKVPRHSRALRTSLADTLALISASSDVFPIGSSTASGEAATGRIVATLFNRMTRWEHWASIAAQLGLLAEAAPEVFLRAVERLSESGSVFSHLFAGDRYTRAPMDEIVRALEVLSWNADLLTRATLVLANLARADPTPDANYGMRPRQSLRGIFLLWHPCTSATLERRLNAIDLLRKRYPEVAWQLLADSLPKARSIAVSTATPQRRDWKPDDAASVTLQDVSRGTSETTRRMRDDAGTLGARWAALVDLLHHLSDADYDANIDRLAEVEPSAMTTADRTLLCDEIRAFVVRHRKYARADWAVPEQRLRPLDAIAQRLEPSNLVERDGWLFGAKALHRIEGSGDWRADVARLEDMQRDAVQRILDEGDVHKVLQLGLAAERPSAVGFALGRIEALSDEAEQVILKSMFAARDESDEELAIGFLRGRRRARPVSWFDDLRKSEVWTQWGPRQHALCYRERGYSAETWTLLASEPEATNLHYWSCTPLFSDVSADDQSFVDQQLLRLDLLDRLVDSLAARSHTKLKGTPDPKLALAVLERIASTGAARDISTWSPLAHDVARLLDVVEGSGISDEERLGRIEWYFFPLTRHFRQAVSLQRRLARAPDFFVDLLCAVFREQAPDNGENPDDADSDDAPDDSDTDNSQPDEHAKARAVAAFELLEEWRRPPGTVSTNQMDGDVLRSWVLKARSHAIAANRLRIADERIGEMLAGAARGTDKLWPHEAVRDLVEELGSDELERGIDIGRFNSRGLEMREVSKSIERSRRFAKEHAHAAGVFADRWPRMAALLRRMAEGYLRDVARHVTRLATRDEEWTARRPIRQPPQADTSPGSAGTTEEEVEDFDD